MKFDLKRPCDNCPFRSDRVFFLGADRVWEIVLSVARQDQLFPCHKTTTFDEDEDGETVRLLTDKEQQCAGASIMLAKDGAPNAMLQIAERFGLYQPARLHMDAPVYETAQAMIDAICEADGKASRKLPRHAPQSCMGRNTGEGDNQLTTKTLRRKHSPGDLGRGY